MLSGAAFSIHDSPFAHSKAVALHRLRNNMDNERAKRFKVSHHHHHHADHEVREPSTPPRGFPTEPEPPKSAPLPATPKRGNSDTLPSPSRSLKRSQMSPLMLPKIQDDTNAHQDDNNRDDEFCDRPHNDPPSVQRLMPRMSRFKALKKNRREFVDVAVELLEDHDNFPAVVVNETTPEIIPMHSPPRRQNHPHLPMIRDRPPR